MARKAGNDFEVFARRELMKDPKRSARSLQKEWRDMGNTVSRDRANAVVRESKGTTYNPKKATRTRMEYRPMQESGKQYLNTYSHVVKYKIQRADGTKETQYVTVTSDQRLTKKSIIEQAKEFVRDGIQAGKQTYNHIMRVFSTSFEVEVSYADLGRL